MLSACLPSFVRVIDGIVRGFSCAGAALKVGATNHRQQARAVARSLSKMPQAANLVGLLYRTLIKRSSLDSNILYNTEKVDGAQLSDVVTLLSREAMQRRLGL